MVEDLFAKAATLPEDERAALAALLLDSLEDESREEGAEQAWAVEVERRMASYRAGNVQTIAWSELRERLHRRAR
ncbi:MAG: putative addiction module component [Thermoanaerobaculia bacterium]|jgi:putative addiction module component (TIGR02574 family)|nr:putative addiction module component [Thermoanaerobaculia bacterium]